jgi:cytochrome P450
MTTIGSVATGVVGQATARAVMRSASYRDLDGVVHPACRWLRAHAPVSRIEGDGDGDGPAWAIARHADIRAVLDAIDVFPPARSDTLPEHSLYRNATAFSFLPAQVRAFEPRLRAIARDAVERFLADDGERDAVAVLSAHYPRRAILELLGVPHEDHELVVALAQDAFAADAGGGFAAYFDAVRRDRLAHPRDDLSSAIVNARLETGESMPRSVQDHLTASIAVAGHDTTNAAITAGLHGLATFPEELARVRADAQLISGLVEESLRWATPARDIWRDAAADTEVRGVPIRAGDRVVCLITSGNFDGAAFPDPHRFDVTRCPNPHLSFSHGPHECLGQHLAKMEMRALFEELLPRLQSVELAGAPRRTAAHRVGGFTSLPVRVTNA